MDSEGRTYADALSAAQALGYAESDPTADVGGHDAAAKAAILAGLAFGTWVEPRDVYREGIDRLELADLDAARQLGFAVKLLATAEQRPDGTSVRVHPTLVPDGHPLASIRGATNAVFVEGPSIGQLLFAGPGAGGDPTATAVLGDVIDAARELLAGVEVTPRLIIGAGTTASMAEVDTSYYVRMVVADSPGVLAGIASVFGENGVSIASVRQDGRGDDATLIIVTHVATERAHQAAFAMLSELDSVTQLAARIRVLDQD
jgi:homoserine dehydrogenase